MKARTTEPSAQIVVAIDAFVTGTHAVSAGMRLRADHPAVLAAPTMFVEDGATDDEVMAAKQRLYADET